MYKGYGLTLDISGEYYAYHVRYNGLIVHTTSYFTSIDYAMRCALRFIDGI